MTQQGDPLSLYLFILDMKRVGHSIHKVIVEGILEPIPMSIEGHNISHFFFFFFCKDDLTQTKILKGIPNHFACFLGHKINENKT